MLLTENGLIPTKTANILKRKKIYTYNDLMEFGPRKYIDYRTVKNINECLDGDFAVITGTLKSLSKKILKNNPGREYLYGEIEQEDGTKVKIFSFINVYRFDEFKKLKEQKVMLCGQISVSPIYGYSINNPDRFVSESLFQPYIKRVYTKFSGISEKKLNEMIHDVISMSEEFLDPGIIGHDNVPDYKDALYKLHYPKSARDIQTGKRRIDYDELLYFAIMLQKNNPAKEKNNVPVFKDCKLTLEFIKKLRFELTKDQRNVIREMIANETDGKLNNILLQGDVGCGKTIVAASIMVHAAENGYQSVLMAPRTVLAKQHYDEISEYAGFCGLNCVFLHSGMKTKERKEALGLIETGKADFIIGTHSCIGKDVIYKNLGLVVADEEHLFGVNQKNAIKEKTEEGLHYISMSATPIPRTIADVLYGDSKEILAIKTKPGGRKDIITKIEKDRNKLFAFMESEIKAGHQCYVVCPAIEDDEKGQLTSIESIEKEYRDYFEKKNIKIDIVNGKMKNQDVEEAMSRFEKGESKILISTTVIEVGINVPDASVMAIEQAERFGLASLHQLRGRVGRSDIQSYCYLISEDEENERLKTLVRTNDGFEIAEADLLQRGAGNLIGTEQSGMNKYINKMLQYPKMYGHIKETAKFCIEHGYGQGLIERYQESENAEP